MIIPIQIIKIPIKTKPIAALCLSIWLLLAAGPIFLTANGNAGLNGNEKKVTKGDFLQTVILTGSLKALKAEEFIVPYSNTWQLQLKWMVREGDYVKAGDPVARFDTSTLVSDIENSEMSLQVKEEERTQKLADYNHQKFELEVKEKQAEVDYKKKEIDASIPKGITTNYEYDHSQLELKKSGHSLKSAQMEKEVRLAEIKSQIKKMEIEIDEIRTKLEKLQETLKKMTLYAGTSGTLVYEKHEWQDRKIQVGDTVFPTMILATIPDKNSLQVEAWVNETDIHKLNPLQKVNLFLDAYPGKRFTGIVKEVLNSAEEKKEWGRSHYFRVDIRMDKRDLDIMKPGMSVRCIVQVAQYPGVLLIPLDTAYFDTDKQVFWVKPKGKQPITINPLGFNESWIALSEDQHREITGGTLLEPLDLKVKGGSR
ncbi:MAG: HlyD family efflux transporter periplasmic adaptor subunit [Candidatus Aminicenantes bacterium]|nr:HlyD family efflux transporter periplasmic adaptor subunit [Candidatus Aminicenantes bacterium]NIM83882.1 HlyD family efflux transporter periplasmic adaptor subunit [Candidatus Aminicenantes bacterium]NIN23346.1 HlyD family efflux transporter periplasmic adaptor subunit [Candidatus Aminicenantes bacterium]NIN47048.1 HlyD family efflux transporter periplasmic adaptor subunit [Candidatus Aminicenantes bacterium]NIN89972.1 HlyD family efflux transporter periplasmic adaptor subunit [Candidatus A